MRKAKPAKSKQPEEFSLTAIERIELLANIVIDIIDEEQSKLKADSYAEQLN
jgi:hypothetical protein